VANDDGLSWPKEEIPDSHVLYMRVHKNNFVNGSLTIVALKDHAPPEGGRPGMSTDWCRYSTPQETRSRDTRTPENYGVVKMQVGTVREIPGTGVEHTPRPTNRAHSDVFGDKNDQEIRLKLKRAMLWVIPLP
jgi:hypothetical protein